MCLQINLSPESELLTLMINHTHCDHWTMSNLTKSIWHNTVVYRSRRSRAPLTLFPDSTLLKTPVVTETIVLPSFFLPCIPSHNALKSKLAFDKALEDCLGMRAEEIGVDERHTRVRKHTLIKRIKKGKEEKSEQRGGADFGSWSFQQSGSAGTWYHLDVICPSCRWAEAGWVKE